ncbi:MAG: sugar ABC transporter permease [Clostridiaceae bacterium]|nr:sugar ABC transporter permease [Clostridiaceae bacterium]
MNKLMYSKRSILVFVLPTLLIYCLIVLLPILVTSYYGLFQYNGMGTMKFIGLDNFIKLLSEDVVFKKAIMNSLILAGSSLFIQLPISLIFALILARGVKFESFFKTVYFIPVVISSMVIGQLWMKIFNGDHGMLNELLKSAGLERYALDWLANEKTAFMATVIPGVLQYIGYHMIIMYAGIKSIPEELYEAAKIDGASDLQASFKITIPLLMPILRVCITFALIGSLKAFDLVYIMTNGGPFHSSEVPSTVMYANLFAKNAYGYGSAQAVFIIIECLVMSLIVQAMFKKSEDLASVI